MKCNIIFKIGDQEISAQLELESSSYPTSDEILEALQNNPDARMQLYASIQENYDQRNKKVADIENLINNSDGLIGNTTVQAVAALNTNITFPEGVNANILLSNKLKLGGKTISGRVINSNGQELFIVENNTYDLTKLANFLSVRKTISDNPNLYGKDSDRYKDLESLRIKFNKNSIAELILDFIENETPFRKEYFKDKNGNTQSVYVYLDKIGREILQYNQCVEYTNPFINTISKLHESVKEDSQEGVKSIKYDELYSALQEYYPNILSDLEINSEESFIKKVKSGDFNKNLFDIVIEGKPLIYTLMTNLIKLDPKYKYEVVSTTSDAVRIKWKFGTLKSEYGVSYPEIKTFDLINNDYQGYKIYAFNKDGKKIYIYSRNYLTEDSSIYNSFDSKEETEADIREKALNEKLKYNSFLNFKFRNKSEGKFDTSKYIYKISKSRQIYTPKTIIESLAIEIDPLTNIKIPKEKELLDSKTATTKDVHSQINSWNIENRFKQDIINKINNAEKAVAFLYKINELLGDNRTDGQELLNIANDIVSRERVAYYINSVSDKDYSLIPTEPNIIENYKQNQSAPVIQTFMAMQDVLEQTTGTKITLLTSSEVSEKFPVTQFPSINPNTSKAFIFNGEIYVNTTIASGEDLLHEYIHIMLGILKSNPESRKHYEELMQNVLRLTKQKEIDQIKRDYVGLSGMDQLEELFVRKFSEYLFPKRGQNIKQISDLFEQEEDYLKDGMRTIFDMIGNEPLPVIYSKTIEGMCKRFSSDIATKLKQNKGLDLELIKDTRKKSNWISKQIQDNNIIEDCL